MPPISHSPFSSQRTRAQREAREAAAAQREATAKAAAATVPTTTTAPTVTAKAPVDATTQGNARLRSAATDATTATAVKAKLGTVDEAAEQKLIGGHGGPAAMVDYGGDARKGLSVSVHGINGAPTDVDALARRSLDKGMKTTAVAYDDLHRRLGPTTAEVKGQIEAQLSKTPRGAPIELNGYSMGARPLTVATAELAAEGKLKGRHVTLNLIAPMVHGDSRAASAGLAPGFIGKLIPTVEPGKDMNPNGKFQDRIDAVTLPANVKVNAFLGRTDTTADPNSQRLKDTLAHLGAKVTVMDGVDHDHAPAAAAALMGK